MGRERTLFANSVISGRPLFARAVAVELKPFAITIFEIAAANSFDGSAPRCCKAAEGHFDGHVTATTLIDITLGTENRF